MIWIFFIIATSIAAYASYGKMGILTIAFFGVLTNLAWAYIATNTNDNQTLIRYAMLYDVGYVLIFAIIPILFFGVDTSLMFWIGIICILSGIVFLNF